MFSQLSQKCLTIFLHIGMKKRIQTVIKAEKLHLSPLFVNNLFFFCFYVNIFGISIKFCVHWNDHANCTNKFFTWSYYHFLKTLKPNLQGADQIIEKFIYKRCCESLFTPIWPPDWEPLSFSQKISTYHYPKLGTSGLIRDWRKRTEWWFPYMSSFLLTFHRFFSLRLADFCTCFFFNFSINRELCICGQNYVNYYLLKNLAKCWYLLL